MVSANNQLVKVLVLEVHCKLSPYGTVRLRSSSEVWCLGLITNNNLILNTNCVRWFGAAQDTSKVLHYCIRERLPVIRFNSYLTLMGSWDWKHERTVGQIFKGI